MARQRPDHEGHMLWRRVAATVTPLPGKKTPEISAEFRAEMHAGPSPTNPVKTVAAPARAAVPKAAARPISRMGHSLDGSWERKLSRGLAVPDRTIDLHGETLSTAHALLERALHNGVQQGARILLIVTGKAPRINARMPPTSRGVIRASVADWIAASPHAPHVAAVRRAHPRHGGDGAIYIILRRY